MTSEEAMPETSTVPVLAVRVTPVRRTGQDARLTHHARLRAHGTGRRGATDRTWRPLPVNTGTGAP
ncbi:hypothetical protein ACFXP3_10010 [Streptomyces sp. NPDC059096]|uniref:hypothetical protein n=1 Tax=unclassified Streptomyces TaxID=2593676 RepID=UPI003680F86B